MTQTERRIYLIKKLLAEQSQYQNFVIPKSKTDQQQLLRSLMNVREPKSIDNVFLKVQNAYLQERLKEKNVINFQSLSPVNNNLYLWQGDITTLSVDAVVNAANSQMTGCYYPCHGCIDNCIHTFAGIELRLECAELMKQQGHIEPTGSAKITKAYNLPSKYIIHSVGPIITRLLTHKSEQQLMECYRSCLELAEQNNINSIAFCCISTGEFHFPNERAAEIAIETVNNYIEENQSKIKVIFNVFKNEDYEIYKRLLSTDKTS